MAMVPSYEAPSVSLISLSSTTVDCFLRRLRFPDPPRFFSRLHARARILRRLISLGLSHQPRHSRSSRVSNYHALTPCHALPNETPLSLSLSLSLRNFHHFLYYRFAKRRNPFWYVNVSFNLLSVSRLKVANISSILSITLAERMINLLLLDHFCRGIDEFERKATSYCIRLLVVVRNRLPARVQVEEQEWNWKD